MSSKEQKEAFQEDIKLFYNKPAQSKGRDGKPRKYGSLVQGRTNVSSVTRIECKADHNSISNKAFDITKTTIENLIAQGKRDANEIL
jgi:hypothetical protein